MTATVRYPANEITPHGWYHLLTGDQPTMRLRAYDGSIDIYLMGGYSIPDYFTTPECVQVPKDGLKGLIPPWRHITQKGATQDGVTNIDALYEPIEVSLKAVCWGRDPQHTRQVSRDLIASIDAKQESELSWITPELGYWWAPVRWFQGAPPDPMRGAQQCRQEWSLRLQADNGFWRSYDDTTMFRFSYETMVDEFGTDYIDDEDLGPNWPQFYSGSGGGFCTSNGSNAVWIDDTTAPYDGREVVNGPYKDFETATDNQVIEIRLGSFLEWTFPDGAEIHIWGRMGRNPDGSWNGDGVKAQIGLFGVQLSRYNNFVETVMRGPDLMLIPPLYGETFTLVCGVEGDPRMFRVLRNGGAILSHKETGTGSELSADHRGIGCGMRAGAGIISQATPAQLQRVSAGDNTTVSQEGFLQRMNIGDQPMYDDYTLFGPGTFKIWDGPGTDEYIEFGPLVANQVAFLRTDPRSKTPLVQDLTQVGPSPQELNFFQQALKAFESFAFANNIPPLLQQINSLFGIVPPQGPFYSLLKGRFSDRAAIPAKSPGNPAQSYYVKCAIDDGNADSRIIASGVPLRRYPL